jgi:hypothetical protein
MATITGSLQPYDPSTDWKLYDLGLTNFFLANDIKAPTGNDPDRRVPILLATIGLRALGIIRSLCAPADPGTKSYADLLSLLRRHYTRTPSKALARQKLTEARQSETESIDEFMARLRELSLHCQYKNATLNEVLRVTLINEVRYESFKNKLLEAENETLDNLLVRVRTFEQIERDIRGSRQPNDEAHFVKQHQAPQASHRPQGTRQSQVPQSPQHKQSGTSAAQFKLFSNLCYRCEDSRHLASACFFKDKVCNYCH